MAFKISLGFGKMIPNKSHEVMVIKQPLINFLVPLPQ
jgi:hypothetical protein